MSDLPEDITALKAALAASERRADRAEIERDEAIADAVKRIEELTPLPN